jgi:invasion protein IalB
MGGSLMATRSAFTMLTLSSALAVAAAMVSDTSRSYAQQLRRDVPAEIIRPSPSAAPQPQPDDQPLLTFSPWTKYCLKSQEASAGQACFTGKDGRAESGLAVVAAVLIEQDNNPKKVLRVILPLGIALKSGTRVIVDNGEPMTASYVTCFHTGCMSDYEASGELIEKLKKGRGLVIQAINGAGQPITFVMPLADFIAAYDGPPTDPKVFAAYQESQQQKPRIDPRIKPWRDDTLQRRIFQKSIQQ